jgi:hypothetical protein
MRKLFNLFRKSEPVTQTKSVDDLRKPAEYYDINGKRFAIADSMNIKVQASFEDIQVYGWTLEVRWKHNGEWHQWMTYWNHRIYQTRQSALDAAIKVYPSYHKDYEWRIAPLYKMNQPEWRQYQIDQLLWDSPYFEKKLNEVRAWRVIEDWEETFNNVNKVKFKKGTIFIQLENGNIVRAATTSDPTSYGSEYLLLLRNYLLPKGKVEEIDIRNEKWIHPHLCKELKTKLKKQ